MKWMTTIAIACLGVSALFAQEPLSTVIYDVRDLVPKVSGGGRETSTLAALAKELESALAGVKIETTVIESAGTILIRSDDGGQTRVRDHLAALRRSLLSKWKVVVVCGRSRAAIDPAADPAPKVDFAGRASLKDAAGKAIESAIDIDAPAFVRLDAGKLHVDMPADDSAGEAKTFELEAASLGSKAVRPNEKESVDLGRLRRFVCGYRVIDSVEGYPQGLVVPELTEVFDGTRVVITITPSLDGKYATVECEARFAEVVGPAEERSTPNGPIRVPTVREREVSARMTIPDGAAFLLRIPESASTGPNAVLVMCSRAR